ncbi:hypothetical protein GCM10009530_40190 [Microbispora corallina]|uniref:Uncharacterized protein n=1 Tax=Microbispora corallina TaxID=83302 RepID=A0ABQ4GBC1_9ACTN|nr:hypothetical protein Mco01_73680 [Microbispora corallina]
MARYDEARATEVPSARAKLVYYVCHSSCFDCCSNCCDLASGATGPAVWEFGSMGVPEAFARIIKEQRTATSSTGPGSRASTAPKRRATAGRAWPRGPARHRWDVTGPRTPSASRVSAATIRSVV